MSSKTKNESSIMKKTSKSKTSKTDIKKKDTPVTSEEDIKTDTESSDGDENGTDIEIDDTLSDEEKEQAEKDTNPYPVIYEVPLLKNSILESEESPVFSNTYPFPKFSLGFQTHIHITKR